MATTPNFTGQQINLTYKSVLHFGNSEGLTVNQQDRIYDGSGVSTCLQLAPSGGTAIFDFWFRLNGVIVTNSASRIQIQGNNAEIFSSLNYFFNLKANDYVELMFAVTDLSVELKTFAAAAPHPGIPSIILTVNTIGDLI